jgi:hypothetical protein
MELEDLINEEKQARKKLKELKENKTSTPHKLSHTKRVLIFIGTIFLFLILSIPLNTWSKNTGHIIPRWPAGTIIVFLYFYLFRKK